MSDLVFEDISDKFLSACSQLKYGEIVALTDFSYQESMSAVELLDSRLDSGMALLSLQAPSPPADLHPAQLHAYLDTTLIHLAQWLEGQSLPHTLYSSIFLHNPTLIEENLVLQAITNIGIYFSETLHKLIHTTTCLREDDYAYASLDFEIDLENVESLMIKAEKLVEDEECLGRMKFLRGLYCVISNLLKPEGIAGAENYLAFAVKQFSLVREASGEDVSHLFNKNFCLKRLPHFLPNKIYDAKNYDFARTLQRIGSFLKSLEYLTRLKEIHDMDEMIEGLGSMPSFDVFSRTLYETLLFTQGSSQIMVFGKSPLSEFILKSMQKFGVDIEFLQLSEEFSYYLARVEIVFKEYILLKLKNRTRQQRILSKYLSDFNILVSEGHFLTEKCYGKGSTKPEKQLLFQWIFHRTSKAMIELLRYSFELQLYTDKDIGMVMFYLDFLHGVVFSNLNSQAQYFNSKQCKKKKKKFDLKSNEIEAKYSLGIQFLCRGIVRLYILLNSTNNLAEADEIERIRFQKRFRAFAAVQMPQLIEYASYQSIKSIPQSVTVDKFADACKECFDYSRSALSEIEQSKPVKTLLRICVKNLLALSKAKKLEWKCKIGYEFVEDKVFPVFLIDQLP